MYLCSGFFIQPVQGLAQRVDRHGLGQVLQAQTMARRQMLAGLGRADQQHALLRLQLGPERVEPVVDAAWPGRHQYQQRRRSEILQIVLQALWRLAAFGAHAPASEQTAHGIQAQAVERGEQGGAAGQQAAELVGCFLFGQ